MTTVDASIPSAPTDSEARGSIVDLLLRPEVFFVRLNQPVPIRLQVITMVLMTVAAALDRALALHKSAFSFPYLLGFAVVAGPVTWFLGQFVFKILVWLSGGGWEHEHARVLAIFAYSNLVSAAARILPTAVLLLHGDADQGDGRLLTVALFAEAWATFIRHRTARLLLGSARIRSFLFLVLIPLAIATYQSWRSL
jgi:hypothetical protein